MRVDNPGDDDMIVITVSRKESEALWELGHMAQILLTFGAINRGTYTTASMLRDKINAAASITEIH